MDSAANPPSPLRKTFAYHDLPSLSDPERRPNPCSYPTTRPSPGIRIPNETPITLLPSLANLPQHQAPCNIEKWITKLIEYHPIDMFKFSEKYGSAPVTPEDSPSSWTPRSRLRSWSLSPRKVIFIILAICSIMILNSFLPPFGNHGVCNAVFPAERFMLTDIIVSSSSLPYARCAV